jgi:glycerate 2-kinase
LNILIATDKFKDSQTALQICEGLKKGILKTFPTAICETLPLADGGEGTLETLQIVLGGEFINVEVQDPLFRKIQAKYLWIPSSRTAIVEMARASGVELLEEKECFDNQHFWNGAIDFECFGKRCPRNNLDRWGKCY